MVDRLVAVDDADYRLPVPVVAALGTDMGNAGTPIGAQLSATIAGTKRIVPATLMAPRFGTPTLSSAGGVPFPHWSLDGAGATESVNVFAEIPAGWATFNAKLVGINETSGAGDVRLALGVNQLNETGPVDGTSLVSFSTTVVALGVGIAHVVAIGTGLSRPSSGVARLSIQRNSADAADTLTSDWAICWVELTKAS